MSGGDMAWRIGGEPVTMKKGVIYSLFQFRFDFTKIRADGLPLWRELGAGHKNYNFP